MMLSGAQLSAIRGDPPRLVRYLRKDLLSASQEELARSLDVSLHSIVRWENGQTRPTPRNWRKVLELFDVVLTRERAKRSA